MPCDGVIGRNARLYIDDIETDTSDTAWGAGGAYELDPARVTLIESANWVEVCAVDVDYDGTKEKIDTSDRCSGDYKAYVPGQQEGTISFKAFKRKPIASGGWLDILRTAYANNSVVSVMMLDDDKTTTGADGILANCNVFNLSESQPLNGPVEISFELAISGCVNYSPPARPITHPGP